MSLKLLRGLRDDFAPMRNEQRRFEIRFVPPDYLAGNNGLARSGRGHQEDLAQPLLDAKLKMIEFWSDNREYRVHSCCTSRVLHAGAAAAPDRRLNSSHADSGQPLRWQASIRPAKTWSRSSAPPATVEPIEMLQC